MVGVAPGRSLGPAASVRSPTEVPEDLDTARAKLCYLALATRGPSTVDELTSALDERKLALLSVLERLTVAGHVECDPAGRYAIT